MSKKKRDEKTEEDIVASLSSAMQKFVAEKFGEVQNSILASRQALKLQEPKADEASYLRDNVMLPVQAKVSLERTDFEVSENFPLTVQLENLGKTPVSLGRIYGLVPSDFDVVTLPGAYRLVNAFLDLRGLKLNPYCLEDIDLVLRPMQKGTFTIAPRLVYTDSSGMQLSSGSESVSINVSETVLPNRIKTGFQDLDSLLFGGIPRGFGVILTSVSCDERDLLVKRFLEAGAQEGNTTVLAVVDPEGARSLAEEYPDSIHVLVCSQSLSHEFRMLSNVRKAGGVENLTEINIAFEKMLSEMGNAKQMEKRDCLEILSDVVLEHGAVQTRKWLNRLIPELRSRGFTTLAVIDPEMHSSEELHALLDLFEGEISIYGKESDDFKKYLRIKKMHRQRYVENEILLKKMRLMTAPLTLSCCTRAFKV